MFRNLLFVLLIVTSQLACGASELDQLRTRAAFDMNCSRDEIQVQNLDEEGSQYGVSGCGGRETYLYHCDPSGFNCKWVRN